MRGPAPPFEGRPQRQVGGARSGRTLALLTSLWLTFGATLAGAQVSDRNLAWRSVESEHFVVHYPEGLAVLARRVAALSERAHARLAPILQHEPSRRVHVVLSDEVDFANGSATALPYPTTRLFATSPDDLSTLGDYDDWLSLLVTHEHTHVLHLDTVGGLPRALNGIFGRVFSPNNVQPRWFIEGLAVHEETEETGGGRLRSTLFEMFMRMATLEDALLGLDQLSTGVDQWPRGNAWYLYGSRFVDFVAHRHGREALTAMSQEYARRLVPYGLNRTARRATGESVTELYAQWQAHLRAKHGAVRDRVEAEGRVEGRRLTFRGETARAPRFLDDGTLVHYAADRSEDPQLRLVDVATGAHRQLTRAVGIVTPAPARGGRDVWYGALDNTGDVYFQHDLFRFDRATGERTRITEGFRAREPDVSPDGRRVAFTVDGAGTTHLMIARTDDVPGTARLLVRSRRYEQIYTPRFSPDGRRVAFSRWTHGGFRDLAIADVETGALIEVTRDRALDTGPCWSADGRSLYFSSDRSGIANLHRWDEATGAVVRLTNVLAGAYSPDLSPDGRTLAYLGYTSRGWDLWMLPLDQALEVPATPYVDTRPAPIARDMLVAPSRRYQPGRSMWPRAWTLDLGQDTFGSELGLNVSGEDAVGYYAWNARVATSLITGYTDVDASFRFARSRLPLTVRAFRNVERRGGLRVGGANRPWTETSLGASADVAYPIRRQLYAQSLSAGYTARFLDPRQRFEGRLDPNDPPPRLPETGWFTSARLGWVWSDVRRHPWDVTPSEGRRLTLRVGVASPAIGSDFESVNASWSWTRFVEAPWAQHHVFALRYGGGISGGDLGRRGLFSVGGFPETSLLTQILEDQTLGGVALRGYRPFVRSGTRFQQAQLEYRFPLGRIQRGLATYPVFLNRAYASVFVDAADAYSERFAPRRVLVGVGGELFLDFTLAYVLPYSLRIGLAHGLREGGETQGYAQLGVPF
ncbi:MAG: BamA/TamA family outer membrane protein [Myxococcota bacterium]